MASLIESLPVHFILQVNQEKILQSHTFLASIVSGQILTALQWQEFLLCSISYLLNSILTLFEKKSVPTQLQFTENVEQILWPKKMDLRKVNEEDLKIIEQAGKKKGNKKSGKQESAENNKNEENNADERKEEEEKRQEDWKEAWNKKLEAQEASKDKAFCAAHGFYPKPKTQTNLWIQVSQGKTMQDVQFCFKNVPVPKAEPPPLPPLKLEEEKVAQTPVSEEDGEKGGKKKSKKKGKRK